MIKQLKKLFTVEEQKPPYTVKPAVVEKPVEVLSKEDPNVLIDAIHAEFYSEVDKLLTEAKIVRSTETTKSELLKKAETLKTLGFVSSEEVREAENEKRRLEGIAQVNQRNQVLAEAIEYFSFKYPNYKFITFKSIQKICEKYNLSFGSVSGYIGEIPDKNLQHVVDFKIDKKDIKKVILDKFLDHWIPDRKEEINSWKEQGWENIQLTPVNSRKPGSVSDLNQIQASKVKTLDIVAPSKDFSYKANLYIKNGVVPVKDPIVLQEVIYPGMSRYENYYLIVTAWGQEASDPLVVNEKFN